MRLASFPPIALAAVALLAAPSLSHAQAQASSKAAPAIGRDELAALAKVQIAISQVHDSVAAQLAQAKNKKLETQQQLQEKLRTQVEEVFHHSGMTEADFRHKTFVITSDTATRRVYDSIVVVLTGAPLPGQYVAAGRGPALNLPPGPVATHLGHVVTSFNDTPGGQGLLPVAMAEAQTAAQHAGLAGRNPADLNYMKLHAGHVLHALDPSIVPTGPGPGYGLKKAVTGVITHTELAANSAGASQNVKLHANHITTSARNTLVRADSLISIAKAVQAATEPAKAAALVSQMASLANQLVAGVDANGDGRIGWEQGEGGLQAAQDHVDLLVRGEGRGR